MRVVIYLITSLALLVLVQCQSTAGSSFETPVPAVTPTPTPEIGVALETVAPPTTAVIQTTPTPLPTATATATSTPATHVVAEGDTLFGIAWRNRTSVDEIKTLNPGVKPESLQIGQVLELPPPATPMAPGVVSTAVPIHVEVSHVNTYQTPVGSMWILGEVANQGDFPVRNVQVQITLANQAGEQLQTVVAWMVPAVVSPGETAPFGVLIVEPPADFDYPVVAVTGGETVTDLGTQYLALSVLDSAVSYTGSQVQLSGRIQNAGESPAAQVTVIATLYDNQGNVTGYYQHRLQDALAANETGSFEFEVTPPGGQAVDYSLSVQAVRGEGES